MSEHANAGYVNVTVKFYVRQPCHGVSTPIDIPLHDMPSYEMRVLTICNRR